MGERKRSLKGSFQVNPSAGPPTLIRKDSARWCDKHNLHVVVDVVLDVLID